MTCESAYDILKSDLESIKTCCAGLNFVCGGDGIVRGQWTELVGAPCSGKTQLCMFAASESLRNGGSVVYIDTGASFCATRFKALCSRFEHADESLRFRHFNCHDCDELLCTLAAVDEQIRQCVECFGDTVPADVEFWSDVRLVVVDSLGSLLSTVIGIHGVSDQLVSFLSRTLLRMATRRRCAVITTNYSRVASGRKRVPGLGATWLYAPHNRIFVQQDESDQRVLVIDKSSRQSTNIQRTFSITDDSCH
jgi:RAD51-like protein 3